MIKELAPEGCFKHGGDRKWTALRAERQRINVTHANPEGVLSLIRLQLEDEMVLNRRFIEDEQLLHWRQIEDKAILNIRSIEDAARHSRPEQKKTKRIRTNDKDLDDNGKWRCAVKVKRELLGPMDQVCVKHAHTRTRH